MTGGGGGGEEGGDGWRAYLAANRRGSAARGSIYDPVAGICCHFCRQVPVAASLQHSADDVRGSPGSPHTPALPDSLVAARGLVAFDASMSGRHFFSR